jgi:hypothetical protein
VTPQAADGRFLFGVIDPRHLAHCLAGFLCQVCGRRLERPVVLMMRRRDLTRQCVSEPACHPVISTAMERVWLPSAAHGPPPANARIDQSATAVREG